MNIEFHQRTDLSKWKSIFKEFWVILCQYKETINQSAYCGAQELDETSALLETNIIFNALEQFQKHIKSMKL